MITYDDVLMHESIVMSHIKGSDDTPTEAEIHTLAFITELKKAFPPEIYSCGEHCPSWYQTDTMTPAAGRCKKIQCGGVNRVTFAGDPCLFKQQDAA